MNELYDLMNFIFTSAYMNKKETINVGLFNICLQMFILQFILCLTFFW